MLIRVVNETSVDEEPGKKGFLVTLSYIGNIVKVFTGFAILTFPYGFRKIGLWPGIVIMLLVHAFVYLGFHVIFKLADKIGFEGKDFQNLIGLVSNNRHKAVVKLMMLLSDLGSFVAISIFASDYMTYFFCQNEIMGFCASRSVYLIILFFCNVIFALVPNMRVFSLLTTPYFFLYLLVSILISDKLYAVSFTKRSNASASSHC